MLASEFMPQGVKSFQASDTIWHHYDDVIMGAIASLITSLTIVYSTVYSDADQRKHQSSASLAFVRGIHWGPVNSPHKWPVTQKMFPFDEVIMKKLSLKMLFAKCWHLSSCLRVLSNLGSLKNLSNTGSGHNGLLPDGWPQIDYQCWQIISEVLWHLSESDFTGNAQDVYPWYKLENC